MRRLLLMTLIQTAGWCGCAVPYHLEQAPVPHRWETDPVTGRGYYIYVPTTYNHATPAPLIVSCHGTPPYDVPEHHIREWKALSEKHGCIAVAPSLVATDGILGDGPIVGMLTDERIILSLISWLGYRYNLDRNNVMITGFSGGGFPAYWVGLRHPDVFTVIAARSCNFSEGNTDGWYPDEAKRTPIIIYYGQNDPGAITGQSRTAIAYFRERGFDVETKIIPGLGHERKPEVAMDFFMRRRRPLRASMPDGRQ